MVMNHKNIALSGAFLLSLSIMSTGFAAKPVDLNLQSSTALSFLSKPTAFPNPIQFVELSRSSGVNNTLHIRFQETYQGHRVWGADGIVHLNDHAGMPLLTALKSAKQKGAMDGVIYTDLDADLQKFQSVAGNEQQKTYALQQMVRDYQTNGAVKGSISDEQSELVVYVDDHNKAHWAYHISFTVTPDSLGMMPAKPVFLVDANSLQVYQTWDNIQTLDLIDAPGGGFGGNKKMGKVIYDGISGHLAKLKVSRDVAATLCTLENKDVVVKGYRSGTIVKYDCKETNLEHNNVYWDGDLEAVNDGYSPPNDALFGGDVIKSLYQQWYGYEVLTQNGRPMQLVMVVHDPIDNAFWDGRKMTFGDGVRMFYPLTSLGVAAHEISHGFTQQHSGLQYYGQSGGMNEAFSDMAAQAAEVFAYGKNSWEIGPEIFKQEGKALRYMCQPSKDCGSKTPGSWCSIDTAKQYRQGLDVHFSSGVYNHFFCALGKADDWTVRKAFEVMIYANDHYWSSTTNFASGACGVLKAAKALGYDTKAVLEAIKTVEIDIDPSKC